MEGTGATHELLSVDEVASYLGVGPITVYRWCRRHNLHDDNGERKAAAKGRHNAEEANRAPSNTQAAALELREV